MKIMRIWKNLYFCELKTKYAKGTNSREPLIQAVDLRADKVIRDIATQNSDERILVITSRDIAAAEAHYHATCYKLYTKKKYVSTDSAKMDDSYKKAENAALYMLFEYIRLHIFSNPRIVPLTDLTLKLVSFLSDKGTEAKDSTKKHIHRNLELEFGDTLHFFEAGRTTFQQILLPVIL